MLNLSEEKLPNLNALIIGINKYKHLKENKYLDGCVNDAKKIYTYLSKVAGNRDSGKKFNYNPKIIKDEHATRENIIKYFEEHLIENSNKGDLNIFYFSGHGSTEKAGGIFLESNHDKKLEGIFCYDSGEAGAPLIADKELRYLIHKLSQKGGEILTIFDCCHSGDNTRDNEYDDFRPKLVSQIVGPRGWSEFVFGAEIKEPENANMLNDVLPEGKHIQISACMASEKAYESEGSGFFTTFLLKVLNDAKGTVSYVELQRRISQALRINRVNQRPKLYTPRGYHKDLFKLFLSGVIDGQSIVGNIMHDNRRDQVTRERIKWRMDLGKLHGVKEQPSLEEADQIIMVDLGDGQFERAWVDKVSLNYCEIEFENPQLFDTKKTYKGRINGLMMSPTYVLMHPDAEEEGAKVFMEEVMVQKEILEGKNIFFVDNNEKIEHSETPYYRILPQKGRYFITGLNDNISLGKAVIGHSTSSVNLVLDNLAQMSQWNFIKGLENPESQIPKNPIKLTVELNRKEYVLDPWSKDPFVIGKDKGLTGDRPPDIRFKLENQSHQNLHIACLYMDSLFGVEVNLLAPTVAELTIDKNKIWALGGSSIQIELEENTINQELPYEEVRLKLIIARKTFDVDIFYKAKMEGIKDPRTDKIGKGFQFPKIEKLDSFDWCTQDFVFRIENPFWTGS